MTEEFSRQLRYKSGSHDDDASGVGSKVDRGVTPSAEPETSPVEEKSTSDVLESGGVSKRVRTPRVLTNVSTLGEMHLVGIDVEPCIFR